MLDTRIILSGLWVATMLTFLWGDVLRIIVGDSIPGETVKFTQVTALVVAALMLTPILMVVLSLVLPQSVNRWANIIVAAVWFLFNLASLRTYPGHFDKFLLAVSMVFNVITVWYAWQWV